MTWLECAVIVLAGTGAGNINTVVGSGTLVTFLVLLQLGSGGVARPRVSFSKIGRAPVKKYAVDLSKEEAEQLRAPTHEGACGARKLRRAHILLAAEERGSPTNG